jgi:LacI family transcriptional regulator
MSPERRTSSGRATLKDVAARAGVSTASASFALRGQPSPKVSEATRQRVLSVAEELHYRPNAMARQLGRGRSSLVGLISDSIATTPFAGELIRGAQEAAWEKGYVLLVVDTAGDRKREHEAVAMMLEHQVHGVVYSTFYHRRVSLGRDLAGTRTVLADCYVEGDGLTAFVPDEVQGGRSATEMLLEKGHRRVAFINERAKIPAAIGRLRGYKETLAAWGVPFDSDLVVTVPTYQEGGYDAGLGLLSRPSPPTAFFCYNDRTAMGVYDAARHLGLRIPDDVAVVGFDNQEEIAAHLRPGLSTVALPHYEMGRASVEWLLGAGDGQPARRVALPCPSVVRGSV